MAFHRLDVPKSFVEVQGDLSFCSDTKDKAQWQQDLFLHSDYHVAEVQYCQLSPL